MYPLSCEACKDCKYHKIDILEWIKTSGVIVKYDTDELIGVPMDYDFQEYNSVLSLHSGCLKNGKNKEEVKIK